MQKVTMTVDDHFELSDTNMLYDGLHSWISKYTNGTVRVSVRPMIGARKKERIVFLVDRYVVMFLRMYSPSITNGTKTAVHKSSS